MGWRRCPRCSPFSAAMVGQAPLLRLPSPKLGLKIIRNREPKIGTIDFEFNLACS